MSIIRIVHKECLRKKTKRYVYNKNSTQGMFTKEDEKVYNKNMSIIRIVHKECLQKKTKRYVYNKNSTQGMFTKEDEKVCL